MENFFISLNAVLPIFFSMAFGFFLMKIGIVDEKFALKLNSVIFKAFFPITMFENIYKTDVNSAANFKLILFAIIAVILSVAVLYLLIPRIIKENPIRGVVIQCGYRSNFVLFGIPLAINLFGEENTGVTAMLVAFIVPLYNILAVIVLESFNGGSINIKKMIKNVIKNPLIIGAFFGVIVMVSGISLPKFAQNTIKNLSNVTTPMALLCLGATFKFSSVSKYIKNIVLAVSIRLFIMPAIFLTVAVIIGFRGIELFSLMAMLTTPVAVASYSMAQQMGGDGEFAGQLVVWTSFLSVFTIFLWIFCFKQMAFI